MTKLTDTVQGLNKPLKKFNNYKYVPKFRALCPPLLRDDIRGTGERVKGRVPPCLQEMALMLQCMKAHEYAESTCDKEVKAFYKCVADTEKSAATKKAMAKRSIIGMSVHQMTGKQANELLQRYPQPPKLSLPKTVPGQEKKT